MSSNIVISEFQNGLSSNKEPYARKARPGHSRSVHFSSPVLEEDEAKVESNKPNVSKEPPANYLHMVISIFSLFVGSVAIAGCILLYFELSEINIKVETQKNQVFGLKSSSTLNKLSGISPQQGWMHYFQTQLDLSNRKLDDVKKWINTSGCIKGHDFSTR